MPPVCSSHPSTTKARHSCRAKLTILQILSLALFEKTPLDQLLNDAAPQNLDPVDSNQLAHRHAPTKDFLEFLQLIAGQQ